MARISPATVAIGIFAILFGLAGAYGIRLYLLGQESPPAEAPPEPERRTVVTASIDLPAGRELVRDDLIVRQVLLEDVAPLAVSNPSDAIGRVLREPIGLDETLTLPHLYAVGTDPGIADKLQPGYRAVTIEADGVARVGSYVDVHFHTQEISRGDDGRVPEATYVLIRGAEVLDVSDTDERGRSRQPKFALAVSPQDAQKLTVVEGRGELTIVVRNSEEPPVIDDNAPDRTTLEDLLGLEKPVAPWTTEIYRGGGRQTLAFERDRVQMERFGGVDAAAASRVLLPGGTATASTSNNNP